MLILKQARALHTAFMNTNDNRVKDVLWDLMWDMLIKIYGHDYNKICYVTDLFLISSMSKKYGDTIGFIHRLHHSRV